MTKLTVSLRDAIIENALDKSGWTKAWAAYSAQRKAWAEAVADESLGGADAVAALAAANKKVARIIAALPEQLRSDLRVGPLVGGIIAAFGGRRTHVNQWDSTRPAKGGLSLAANHPLTVEFERLEHLEKELVDRKTNLRAEVRAVLNSVTTVSKLIKVWPEAKELLPAHEQKGVNLPSVQLAKLNEAIGLPTPEVAND